MRPALATLVPKGPVWAAQLFLLSLLVPFHLPVGTLLLMPHRIVLLVLFVPFFLMLFLFGRCGRVLLADWCMLFAALWAGVSLFANHAFEIAIEPFGIHVVEFFGAYLLARVAIRSGADFQRMVWTFFLVVAALLPFAAIESLTLRPVLLDLLPGNNVHVVDPGMRLGMRRAQTIFAHPILFGVFVSTGLGLFWYVLRPRWLRFPAASMVAAATFFSLSVGALISLVVQAVFIGWEMVLKILRWRWILFVVLAVGGYVMLDLLSNRTPFHVLVTYASFSSGSAYNRILIWQHGTANVWANPFIGLGLNDWVRPVWMKASVDNFWLAITMTFGIPEFAFIAVALFQIVRRTSRVVLGDPEDQRCRAGFLVALGGLVIAGGTVHYWHAMLAFVAFIFGSGLWMITGGGAPEENEKEPTPVTADVRRSRYTRQPAPGVPIGAVAPKRPAEARRRG